LGRKEFEMANIRQVAREAGVSIATVSAVMNNTKAVSPELTKRVLQAIEKLDYRPNLLAKALLGKNSGLIAFLVPSMTNPFYPDLLEAVEHAASERNYGVFICTTHRQVDRVDYYRERLLGMNIDGAMVTLSSEIVKSQLVQDFLSHGIKVVGITGGRVMPEIDCYVLDDETSTQTVCSYLSGLGHREVVYLGPDPAKSTTSSLRYKGIQNAIKGLLPTVKMELATSFCTYSEGSAYQAAISLLASGRSFSAIICYNDQVAVGVVNALKDQGLDVPDDVSVIGFDDTVASYTRPALTTMAVDRKGLAEAASTRLFTLIESSNGIEPTVVKIPMSLVVRGSTAAGPYRSRPVRPAEMPG